jgi:type I restriction enzyme S subunit
MVAKKRRLIELLQEQRTALITRAVTKGLDPSVPMKDSGVAWLGEIPAHWEVKKLKNVCSRVFVGIAEAATDSYVDDGVPMLRSTDIRGNRIRTDDIRFIDPAFAGRLGTKKLMAGDIATVRTGNAGVSAVVPIDFDGGQCFTLVVSRPKIKYDSRYFCYWLNCPCGAEQFKVEGVGTAQINISVPIVQNIIVCVPPEPIQRTIADFIEVELSQLDALDHEICTAIERLAELRTSLISAVVTGKIDVREVVA